MRLATCSVFFFSSRRRHTRLVSDWSSDVCSSDLPYSFGLDAPWSADEKLYGLQRALSGLGTRTLPQVQASAPGLPHFLISTYDYDRSEERRVGKECRSRWSPYH